MLREITLRKVGNCLNNTGVRSEVLCVLRSSYEQCNLHDWGVLLRNTGTLVIVVIPVFFLRCCVRRDGHQFVSAFLGYVIHVSGGSEVLPRGFATHGTRALPGIVPLRTPPGNTPPAQSQPGFLFKLWGITTEAFPQETPLPGLSILCLAHQRMEIHFLPSQGFDHGGPRRPLTHLGCFTFMLFLWHCPLGYLRCFGHP
jgi:hypothetical protein